MTSQADVESLLPPQRDMRIHARNWAALQTLGVSDLDSMVASTFTAPAVVTDYDLTIGECLAVLWSELGLQCAAPEGSAVVATTDDGVVYVGGADRALMVYDVFSADDGWPGPTHNYSHVVSPILQPSEVWRHLGRAEALQTYTLGDAYSISRR